MTLRCFECHQSFEDGDLITANGRLEPPILRHRTCHPRRMDQVELARTTGYGIDPRREKDGVCWHGIFADQPCSICDAGADR